MLVREGENILYISFQRGCAPLKPLLWEAGAKRTLTGGARGVLVPGGHRPGPTEATAETGAPPRRGVARGFFPLRGDTKGGLSPFEE